MRGPKLKDYLVLCSATIVLSLGARAWSERRSPTSESSMHGGALSADSLDFDFGQVNQGITLSHEFALTNSGTIPIEVLKVSASCGCTDVGDLRGRLLPPGQTVKLPVRIDTSQKDGRFGGIVTLYYRPSSSPIDGVRDLEMHLLATIIPEASLEPTSISLGTVYAGLSESREIMLRIRDDVDGRLFKPATDDGLLSIAELPDRRPSSRTYRITLNPPRTHQGTRFESYVRFLKDGAEKSNLRLLVRAEICPLFRVEPTSMSVGADVVGVVKRNLVIRSERPHRIKSISCPDARVHMDLTGSSSANVHEIHIDIDPLGGGTAINTEISVGLEVESDAGGVEAVAASIPIDRLGPSKE